MEQNNFPKFIIGFDDYDQHANAYCLGRIDNKGNLEILLSKTLPNKDEFDKEVENIIKYFNAEII